MTKKKHTKSSCLIHCISLIIICKLLLLITICKLLLVVVSLFAVTITSLHNYTLLLHCTIIKILEKTKAFTFLSYGKVVICHPLCHNLEMWKFLVILVIIKLHARLDMFKKQKNL